uniref:Uncharacterized protein n=1 Tax=Glossina pallidipes TaxID=7398 RepID=A0A1A9ZUR4_GLOPL
MKKQKKRGGGGSRSLVCDNDVEPILAEPPQIVIHASQQQQRELQRRRKVCSRNIDNAGESIIGIQELNSSRGVYPWQTFKPNCNELQYICGIISEKIKRRLEILNKNRESVERDEKPNEWCAYRIELSTSQRIEKCSKSAELMFSCFNAWCRSNELYII